MGLPTLGVKISDKQKKAMSTALQKYRAKVAEKRQNTSHEEYKLGEEVLVFSPKTNRFLEKGTITSYLPSTECQIPPSYYVTLKNNHVLVERFIFSFI